MNSSSDDKVVEVNETTSLLSSGREEEDDGFYSVQETASKNEAEVFLDTTENSSQQFPPQDHPLNAKSALVFIIAFGLCSCFADMTYEGARSAIGPYLQLLGASATTVGVVVGSGEFIGYTFRFVSGALAERTGTFWFLTYAGYFLTIISVFLLSVTTTWQFTVALIVLERVGKGIRKPPRDAMLSYAGTCIGQGRGFGIHGLLDQIGAVLGPLFVSSLLSREIGVRAMLLSAGEAKKEIVYSRNVELESVYRTAFAFLVIPGVIALVALTIARFLFPHPQNFETTKVLPSASGLQKKFWVFALASCLIALGFIDFPLVAYHLQRTDTSGSDSVLSSVASRIPLLYAVAMGSEAFCSPVLGVLYDRVGLQSVFAAVLLSALAAPLLLIGEGNGITAFTWTGAAFWGLGMSIQGVAMPAMVGHLVPPERRTSAYGLLSGLFGLSWATGSLLMGALYDASGTATLTAFFSLAAQIGAAAVLFYLT